MNLAHAQQLYHRAIWALDSKGYVGRNEQMWLMRRWLHCSRLAAIEGGDPDFFGSEVKALIDVSERAIRDCETDHDRRDYERQRDYLLGVVSRCLRAANIQLPPAVPQGALSRIRKAFIGLFMATSPSSHRLSPLEQKFVADLCAKLHYYAPDQEDFHADLGLGYFLWQGLRAELKMGITMANIDDDAHASVKAVADNIRNVIFALEHGDGTSLRHYEKSKLHLSDEQHRKQLWEAVVNELKWILRDNGKTLASKLLA